MSSLLSPFAWDWPAIANLFGLMALSCLFSFGGANGPVIVVQNRLVDTGELAVQPFAFLLGLAYMLPGPKAAFVGGIGYYLAGPPGAVAALLGLALPAAVLAAFANRALVRMQALVDAAKPATGYIIAGIIGATAYSTSRPLPIGGVGLVGIAAVAYLIAQHDVEPLPLILVALAIGGVRVAVGMSG